MRFTFTRLLQMELDAFCAEHNAHKPAASRHIVLAEKPDLLFHIPEAFGMFVTYIPLLQVCPHQICFYFQVCFFFQELNHIYALLCKMTLMHWSSLLQDLIHVEQHQSIEIYLKQLCSKDICNYHKIVVMGCNCMGS